MRNLLLPQFLVFLVSLRCFGESTVPRNGSAESTALFHVGLVLNLKSKVGEMAESCISMALSDFYDIHTNYSTRLVLHTVDSRGDSIGAASAALYLMKDVEVQAIIGPQQSTQSSFVIDLGEKAQVPIVSFSATSPSLSPFRSPYFIRTAIDDSTQVKVILAIIQTFGWKEVNLIYEDSEYGNGVIPYFIDAFQDIVRAHRTSILLDATDDQILTKLQELKSMQTRVFIVHMSSSVGSRLFINADKAGMMSQGYAWIVTDGLSILLPPMDSNAIDSMEGVLGVRPYIPKSKKLDEFLVRWKKNVYSNKSFSTDEISEPSLYGLWAYDTVWALAMAVEQIGSLDPHFLSNTTDNLTDLSGLKYSPVGPQLLQTILNTSFRGLSGDFQLVKGQLKSFAFQIFNVFGEGERLIGYWTPAGGISRQLHTTNKPSMSNLKTIIWPGDSTTKPKGWAIPTNSKEYLKVLVPEYDGFNQFVKVEGKDHITNKASNVTGYSIDVFRNATSRLPFGLSYEFYAHPIRKDSGSYDELVSEVYIKNFDAALGDITIWENRSTFVDFTVAHSESGVVLVVPMQDDLDREVWMFIKPLSRGLWLVTIAGFIYIGVIVWILEYPTNTTLGLSRGERLQASLWYSFLTLIFAQRERIDNHLTRAVLLTWVFYVLILTQSYTASLSSTLTARQFKPTITDVDDIKNSGYYVGYHDGSFVKEFLIEDLHLDKLKLKSYSSPEEYDYALSNGEVAAIFDELPYIQILLNMYCKKYTTTGPTYSSAGFGFVFQKGSPLVSSLSKEILGIIDDGTLDTYKGRWLENQTNCNNANPSSTSTNQLTLRSFGGLFLIIIVVSGLSLLLHLSTFVYTKWQTQTTKISPKLRWQKAGYKIIYITTALKGMSHVTEVGSVELQRVGSQNNREEGIVEGGV